ncbi:MAG TPA: AarF/ABC1/UbiB kinase family protein [Solirubrobacteraceae bacterium]|nr:AarF/ABC1/UbiB kinase family protein [Solirubrobacteraceae bacterium]
MDYLVAALGLERWVSAERALHGRRGPTDFPTAPQDLRLALEELGPTFIKLGQLLSTRADVLPADYQAELAKLQDAGPRVSGEIIKATVEEELSEGVDVAFGSFDSEPMAAASIGQVHAATLSDGARVVVKVRRPGVVEVVEQDLAILKNLAASASRHWEWAAQSDVVGVVDEIEEPLRAQLDYLQEGRNAGRFATNFEGDSAVHIPSVYWDLTTSRMITLERIDGMKISDLGALDAAGIDRHKLAERAAGATAKMVFEDGFFHADPHPGNFFIEPDGRIGIVDFGLVGTLDDRLRARLRRLLTAFVREDPERLADAMLALGASTEPVDRTQLTQDMRRMLNRYFGRTIGEIALGPAIRDMLGIVRRYRLRVPVDLALLLEVVAMDEGITQTLDPQFRFAEALAPYARPQILGHVSAAGARHRLEDAALDLEELATEVPGELRRLLAVLSSGDFELHVRAVELERLIARGERVGDRIAWSVVAAAALNGLAAVAISTRALRRKRRKPNRPGRLLPKR